MEPQVTDVANATFTWTGQLLSCSGELCGVRVIPAVDVAVVQVKAARRCDGWAGWPAGAEPRQCLAALDDPYGVASLLDAGLVSPAEGEVPPAAPGGCWRCGERVMAGCGCLTGGGGGTVRGVPGLGPGGPSGAPGGTGRPAGVPCSAPAAPAGTLVAPSPADSLSGPVGYRAHRHRSKQRQDVRHPRLGAGTPRR